MTRHGAPAHDPFRWDPDDPDLRMVTAPLDVIWDAYPCECESVCLPGCPAYGEETAA